MDLRVGHVDKAKRSDCDTKIVFAFVFVFDLFDDIQWESQVSPLIKLELFDLSLDVRIYIECFESAGI